MPDHLLETSASCNLGVWVAHCLELDLVAVAPSRQEAEEDLQSIIRAQIEYCINNDNMENLFRSAPQELWDEFYGTEKKKAGSKTAPITFTAQEPKFMAPLFRLS